MSVRASLLVRAIVLYGVALAVPALVGAILATELSEADLAALGRIVEQRAAVLAFFGLLLLLACVGAAKWFFARYVGAAHALAEQARVIRSANPALRVPVEGVRELAAIAAAINELAEAYQNQRRDGDARAAEARARLEEERNRLAALMSELAQGVLVCNASGTILLYNEQARALFAAGDSAAAGPPVGLGRSLFALIDRGQVTHAAEKLRRALERGERLPSTRLVAATRPGRLIKAQAAPFLDADGRFAGLVFALEDVTRLADREAQRRSLLQTLATRIRAPAANLRAAAENLASYPEIDPAERARFITIVASESQALSHTIHEAMREYADALKSAMSLEDVRVSDLLGFVRLRIERELQVAVDVAEDGGEAWVHVDSYSFLLAMGHLAARLRDEHGVRALELRARPAGRNVELDLGWSGAPAPSEALSRWEAQPMQAGEDQSPLSVRDVLDQHGAELWWQAQAGGRAQGGCLRFLIPGGEPPAAPARPARAVANRPEFYDFDLFAHGAAAGALNEARLATLSYTVFDTETTGLEPSAGDEIISIGAVRVVNGKLLRNEVFEQLVDPRRALNPQSASVHGIDAAALEGQPMIGEVLPRFYRFCEDTVLVAHNAAFDMRFLELKQAASGVRFGQPVLDTLLLSAAAHPSLEDHSLDAIAGRLGVSAMGRHTALGDALLTAEIFLKLLPLLAERGIVTLGQALEASRETYYARLQY